MPILSYETETTKVRDQDRDWGEKAKTKTETETTKNRSLNFSKILIMRLCQDDLNCWISQLNHSLPISAAEHERVNF